MTDHKENSDLEKTVQPVQTTEYKQAGEVVRKERKATRKILADLDKSRSARLPDATPMVELWEETNVEFDTNHAILRNMQMVQLRIEAQTEEYWIHKAQIEDRLWELFQEVGPDGYDKFKLAEATALKQDAQEWKSITGLMRLCQVLAKEFRACSMERKANVHVNQVKLLFEAFKAVLDTHVHDEGVRAAIQNDLRPMYLSLFPINVNEGG